MKTKRLLASFMAAILLLTVLPTVALADDGNLIVSSDSNTISTASTHGTVTINSGATLTIGGSGSLTLTSTAAPSTIADGATLVNNGEISGIITGGGMAARLTVLRC